MSVAGGLRVQYPTIALQGKPISAIELERLLIDIRVQSAVGLPAELTMRFRDPDFVLTDSDRFALGTQVAVDFPDEKGADVKVFAGVILSAGVEQVGDSHELVVGALDASYRLDQGSQVRSFLEQSLFDIAGKIAGEAGLSLKKHPGHGKAGAVKYPYLLQTTTNRAFLDDLVFREGVEWWVSAAVLNVGKRSVQPPAKLVFGQDLLRCSARFSHGGGDSKVVVRGWDRKAKRAIVSTSPVKPDPGLDMTKVALVTDSRAKAVKAGSSHTLLAGRYSSDTKADGDLAADGLARRLASGELTGRGEAIGNPKIQAGTKVELDGLGKRVSGIYYVTEVEHVFGIDRPYLTRFVAGGRHAPRLPDMVGGPANGTGSPVPLGLTVGIVTNNADPEGVGRVKVKLPFLSEDHESNWARVITPASGSTTGFFMIPEINDEVLVGFEHGDFRHPVVIGGLWNGVNKPPVAAVEAVKLGKVATWIVKSRTGNTLQFFDGVAKAQAKIVLTHANGLNKVTIEDQRIEVLGSNVGTELSIKIGAASIAITKAGDISLDGNNITINAMQKVAIKANVNLEATANTMAKFGTSAAGVEVNPGQTTVKGGGMVQIQAPMVKVN